MLGYSTMIVPGLVMHGHGKSNKEGSAGYRIEVEALLSLRQGIPASK